MERGYIVSEDVAKVRSETVLSDLFSEVTQVKRQAGRFVALCPFHQERTPSVSIDDHQGLYHCFGCGESGDAYTFIEKTKNLDFRGAVEWAADRAGLTIRYEEAAADRENRVHNRKLHEAVGSVAEFYQLQLLEAPEAGPARKYLRQERHWSGEVVRRFGIGWAPSRGTNAVQSLNLPNDVAFESGCRASRQVWAAL